MRKIITVFILLLFAIDAFGGGRPIQIIRCAQRGQETLQPNSLLKAAVSDTVDRVCYPALLTLEGLEPADICVGDASTVHTFVISGLDSLMEGDAITILSVENLVFVEDSDKLVGNVDPSVRTAFTAIKNPSTGRVEVEVEFTRLDPMLDSKIEFASAVLVPGSTDKTLIIPGCATLAPIATVPTMGEWGLMSLGLILLIFGINALRQNVLRPQL